MLAPHENKINEFKKKKLNPDTEHEFAQMLSQYGDIVKKVEGDLKQYEKD
jgi:hypothetical protein